MAPDRDAVERAAGDLAPGAGPAIAAALREIAAGRVQDRARTAEILAILEADREARRSADVARMQAWRAVASLVASVPGKALCLLGVLVAVAAVARAMGLDVEYLSAFAGLVQWGPG